MLTVTFGKLNCTIKNVLSIKRLDFGIFMRADLFFGANHWILKFVKYFYEFFFVYLFLYENIRNIAIYIVTNEKIFNLR